MSAQSIPYRNRRSPAEITKLVLIGLALAGLIAFVGYQINIFVNRSQVERLLNRSEPFGIMLVGQTGNATTPQTRFCAAAIIFPATSRIGLVSVFPETRLVADEPILTDRIAADGVDEIASDLEELIGAKIPFHLTVRPEQVGRLLDLIEGLDYFLLRSQRGKKEKLPTGRFTMDGSLAPRFLTGHPDNSEFVSAGSLYRHYSFLLNLWQVRKQKWEILKQTSIFNVASRGIESNLSTRELYHLAETLFATDGWLPMFTELPVKREGDNFTLRLETAQFYLKKFMKSLGDEKNPYLDDPPKMEVRNGTRRANLARKVRSQLSRKGLKVLEFSNADRDDYKQSILIDMNANPYFLGRVAKLLGTRHAYHAIDRSLFTDLALIIGEDYKDLKIGQ